METEEYSLEEPACRGCRCRSTSNANLCGKPGRFMSK
ncbi:MAG: hypothetical protein NTZ53_01400 [Cyanobacteria bacterium]|nr:hypothetical protein [Cyanobacteriota bacterium]